MQSITALFLLSMLSSISQSVRKSLAILETCCTIQIPRSLSISSLIIIIIVVHNAKHSMSFITFSCAYPFHNNIYNISLLTSSWIHHRPWIITASSPNKQQAGTFKEENVVLRQHDETIKWSEFHRAGGVHANCSPIIDTELTNFLVIIPKIYNNKSLRDGEFSIESSSTSWESCFIWL